MNKQVYFECASCGEKRARLGKPPVLFYCDSCRAKITEEDLRIRLKYASEVVQGFWRRAGEIIFETISFFQNKNPLSRP
jgi:hypothetical protein